MKARSSGQSLLGPAALTHGNAYLISGHAPYIREKKAQVNILFPLTVGTTHIKLCIRTTQQPVRRETMTTTPKQAAMFQRCLEQGHEWENCCSTRFRIYQRCKWCGLPNDAGTEEYENMIREIRSERQ